MACSQHIKNILHSLYTINRLTYRWISILRFVEYNYFSEVATCDSLHDTLQHDLAHLTVHMFDFGLVVGRLLPVSVS